MKNTIRFTGIIVLAAIIAFSFIACGEEGEDPLNGTWITFFTNGEGAELIFIFVFDNGNFTFKANDGLDFSQSYKGTYSTSGSNISITFTHVNNDDGMGWVEVAHEDSGEFSINGNTMNLNLSGILGGETFIFTKQ